MKKLEVSCSGSCFLVAIVAAVLLAAGLNLWAFVVAWGGSIALFLAYRAADRRRTAEGRDEASLHPVSRT